MSFTSAIQKYPMKRTHFSTKAPYDFHSYNSHRIQITLSEHTSAQNACATIFPTICSLNPHPKHHQPQKPVVAWYLGWEHKGFLFHFPTPLSNWTFPLSRCRCPAVEECAELPGCHNISVAFTLLWCRTFRFLLKRSVVISFVRFWRFAGVLIAIAAGLLWWWDIHLRRGRTIQRI